MQQSRYDLEFLGRMLGLRPGVDYAPSGVVLSDRPSLGNAVLFGIGDPVANARARQRIGDLVAECERVGRYWQAPGDLAPKAPDLGAALARDRPN